MRTRPEFTGLVSQLTTVLASLCGGAISRGYIDLVRHAYYAGMPEWSKGPDSSANKLHRKNW